MYSAYINLPTGIENTKELTSIKDSYSPYKNANKERKDGNKLLYLSYPG